MASLVVGWSSAEAFDFDDDDIDAIAAMSVLGADSERPRALSALMARAAEWNEARGLDPLAQA